jgi:hypothetical protein
MARVRESRGNSREPSTRVKGILPWGLSGGPLKVVFAWRGSKFDGFSLGPGLYFVRRQRVTPGGSFAVRA